MKFSASLVNPQQAHTALASLWQQIKPYLIAGHRLEVMINDRRSDEQRKRFHAICGDVAKSRIEWQGRPRSSAEWKVLFISGHATATGQGAEMIPGLEGEFVNIRESEALMSVRRSASLIEYATAFAVQNNVTLRDPQWLAQIAELEEATA